MDCKVPLTDMLNENLHMQGDTFLVQLFMIEEPKRELLKSATFVGELRIRYKHCYEENNRNNWCHMQLALTDEDQKAQLGRTAILSC